MLNEMIKYLNVCVDQYDAKLLAQAFRNGRLMQMLAKGIGQVPTETLLKQQTKMLHCPISINPPGDVYVEDFDDYTLVFKNTPRGIKVEIIGSSENSLQKEFYDYVQYRKMGADQVLENLLGNAKGLHVPSLTMQVMLKNNSLFTAMSVVGKRIGSRMRTIGWVDFEREIKGAVACAK